MAAGKGGDGLWGFLNNKIPKMSPKYWPHVICGCIVVGVFYFWFFGSAKKGDGHKAGTENYANGDRSVVISNVYGDVDVAGVSGPPGVVKEDSNSKASIRVVDKSDMQSRIAAIGYEDEKDTVDVRFVSHLCSIDQKFAVPSRISAGSLLSHLITVLRIDENVVVEIPDGMQDSRHRILWKWVLECDGEVLQSDSIVGDKVRSGTIIKVQVLFWCVRNVMYVQDDGTFTVPLPPEPINF